MREKPRVLIVTRDLPSALPGIAGVTPTPAQRVPEGGKPDLTWVGLGRYAPELAQVVVLHIHTAVLEGEGPEQVEPADLA
jgi:hypothetical protein